MRLKYISQIAIFFLWVGSVCAKDGGTNKGTSGNVVLSGITSLDDVNAKYQAAVKSTDPTTAVNELLANLIYLNNESIREPIHSADPIGGLSLFTYGIETSGIEFNSPKLEAILNEAFLLEGIDFESLFTTELFLDSFDYRATLNKDRKVAVLGLMQKYPNSQASKAVLRKTAEIKGPHWLHNKIMSQIANDLAETKAKAQAELTLRNKVITLERASYLKRVLLMKPDNYLRESGSPWKTLMNVIKFQSQCSEVF